MSDGAITTIVTGVVTAIGLVVGFLTLWVKLQYASKKAEDAASKAETAVTKADVMERKIDGNTAITQSVDDKANTIVEQTNGSLEHTRSLVVSIAERVAKLEDYNRESSHRILDAVHAMNLKVTELVVLQPKPVIPVASAPASQVPFPSRHDG